MKKIESISLQSSPDETLPDATLLGICKEEAELFGRKDSLKDSDVRSCLKQGLFKHLLLAVAFVRRQQRLRLLHLTRVHEPLLAIIQCLVTCSHLSRAASGLCVTYAYGKKII